MPAQKIANADSRGDAHYYIGPGSGVTQVAPDDYVDDAGYHYDSNGLAKSLRPDAYTNTPGIGTASDSASFNSWTGQSQPASDGGGGGGTYLPPGAAAAIAQELALAKEAYDTALAKITNQRQTLGRQSGFTFDVNKDTGETSNMRVDPHAIYGTYQLLNRQEAQNIQNARATAVERGLGANGGLGAQLSSQAKFDAGQQDAQFASDLTDQLTNLALSQQDAKHAYDQAKWQAELDKIRLALQSPPSYGPGPGTRTTSNPVQTQYGAPGFQNATANVGQVQPNGYSINTGGGFYTSQTNPNQLSAKWKAIGLMG